MMLEIDVPTLMASALPGDRRETGRREGVLPLEDVSISVPVFDWSQAQACVALAEQLARDGYRMPNYVGHGLAGRLLRRACARVALFVQGCFGRQQQQRWDSVLMPLRSLTQHARETDTRMVELATILPQMSAAIRQTRETSLLHRQTQAEQERAFNDALNLRDRRLDGADVGLAEVQVAVDCLRQERHAESHRVSTALADRDARFAGVETAIHELQSAVDDLRLQQAGAQGAAATRVDVDARFGGVEAGIHALQSAVANSAERDEQVVAMTNKLAQLGARGEALDAALVTLQQGLNDVQLDVANAMGVRDERLDAADRALDAVQRDATADRLRQQAMDSGLREELQKRDARIAAVEESTRRANPLLWTDGPDGVTRRLSENESALRELERVVARLGAEAHATGGQAPRTGSRRVDAARIAIGDAEGLRPNAEVDQRRWDQFYFAFEDRFRGARAEVIERLKVYVPLVKSAGAGSEDTPVLDFGCGRGEWLQLMNDEGLRARGVDINRVLVEYCRQRDLDVVAVDGLSHLRSLEDSSMGAVTSFHVIEHLAFEQLVAFLEESMRVLRPGGLLIVETPNPRNVQVGACHFYSDPTHRRPLPSELTEYLFATTGLQRTRVLDLHPYDESVRVPSDGSMVVERFNEHFFGARDYAVIGYKAGRPRRRA